MKTVQDLECWRVGFEVAVDVYEVTKSWPKEELFGLTSQARRAASSIPANIAEGFGRFSPTDSRRFCQIAHGSMWELDTHLRLAQRLGYLPDADWRRLHGRHEELRRLLGGYIRYLDSLAGVAPSREPEP